MMKQEHPALFINGSWTHGSGHTFKSTNPATNELVWQGNSATEADVNMSVDYARHAFDAWSQFSLDERLVFIEAYKEQLELAKDELAQTIHEEVGKPLWEAKTEVAAMIGKVAVSIEAYHERTGHKVSVANGITTELQHRPHGVVTVFGPFNFPGHLPNGHIIPALIAGNTVIFKPSEQAPKTGEHMVQIWQKANVPCGVIQLMQGEKDTGVALANHSGIDGLFFTGSSPTGAILQENNAKLFGKILALEMGGHNPLVVNEITDINAAVYTAIESSFITSGQRCTCARKLVLVKSDQSEAFLNAFIKATQNIKLTLNNTQGFMGPVINTHQASRLLAKQEMLIAAGAKSLVEMTQPDSSLAFVTPGIIDVTGIDVPDEEDFGPLLKVYLVDSLEDAIKEGNNTIYGLSAGLISEKNEDWAVFQKKIRAGIVNWNKPTTGASGKAPFGGPGASGNYRPGAYYAADYCAYPMASVAAEKPTLPASLAPGIEL
ncbi:MAG: succinylglutamate-semialdehyde dehydrogenase [Pseudomonadota bacterium]|nr:succinylglutamate-semialdehyde dehydrogenase [Pseudomonadota bacterium]